MIFDGGRENVISPPPLRGAPSLEGAFADRRGRRSLQNARRRHGGQILQGILLDFCKSSGVGSGSGCNFFQHDHAVICAVKGKFFYLNQR